MLLEENKKAFIEILSGVDRAGIEGMIEFLQTTDFFTAPASHKFNLAYEGGLCEHSLNVYTELCKLAAVYNLDISKESIALVGLLHDIHKIGVYEYYMQNRKVDNEWITVGAYRFKENNERDLIFCNDNNMLAFLMINKFIKLTDEETAAILNYQGNYMNPATAEVYNRYPLALLLHLADMAAMYTTENPYKINE